MQTFGYNPNGSINLTNPVSPHFGWGETARLTEQPAKPIDFANAIMAGVDSEVRGSAARIRALEAENARLQMLLAARGRLDAGEPSNPPTTGRAATPLVPDWRTMSTKTEDGYNG